MRNKEVHKGVWGMRHLQNWANIAWPILINPKRGYMSKTMMRFPRKPPAPQAITPLYSKLKGTGFD